MRSGQELTREREVNRQRCPLKLNPVDQATGQDIEDFDALIQRGANEPLAIRLGEADVCDLVRADIWEGPHLFETTFYIQNCQGEIT